MKNNSFDFMHTVHAIYTEYVHKHIQSYTAGYKWNNQRLKLNNIKQHWMMKQHFAKLHHLVYITQNTIKYPNYYKSLVS